MTTFLRLDATGTPMRCGTARKGPWDPLPLDERRAAQPAERRPVRLDAGRGHGLGSAAPRKKKSFSLLGTTGRIREPDGRRSPSAITTATGSSGCSWRPRPASVGARRDPRSPGSAPIRAMAGTQGHRRQCSTASRIATMRRWCSGGSFARCPPGADSSVSRRATRPSSHDDGARRVRQPAVRAGAGGVDTAGRRSRGRRRGAVAGRACTRTPRLARRGGRTRLPSLRLARRRVSVPGNSRNGPGRRGGLGLSVPHSALVPSGQEVWLEVARQSARAVVDLERRSLALAAVLTERAVHNAMVVHAAFGGSTNLLLHLPAVAHAAGLPRPSVADWIEVNRAVPRLVSVLPNGPVHHPTVRVFLAVGSRRSCSISVVSACCTWIV